MIDLHAQIHSKLQQIVEADVEETKMSQSKYGRLKFARIRSSSLAMGARVALIGLSFGSIGWHQEVKAQKPKAMTNSSGKIVTYLQDDYQKYMELANQAKQERNFADMERLIQRALSYGEGDEYALRSLAWAQGLQGKWEASLRNAQLNVSRHGYSGWSLAQLTESAVGVGNYVLARKALDAARQLPKASLNGAGDSLKFSESKLIAATGTRTYRISLEQDLGHIDSPKKPVWLLVHLKGSPQQEFQFTVRNAVSWKEHHVGIRDYIEVVGKPGQPVTLEGTLTLKPYCLGRARLAAVPSGECPEELRVHLTKFQNASWWDPDYPGVREISRELRGRTSAETVQNVLDWFHKNIHYDATIHDDPKLGQLGTILKCRYGGCHHNSGLFVTLCRAAGIPACVAHGNILPTDDKPFVIPNAVGHGWAEVYLNGLGWVPVEPMNVDSLRAFSAECPYMAMGPSNRPPENHQFANSIQYEGKTYRLISTQGANIRGQLLSATLPPLKN